MAKKKSVRDRRYKQSEKINQELPFSNSLDSRPLFLDISIDERLGAIEELTVFGNDIRITYYEGGNRVTCRLSEAIHRLKKTRLMDCPYASICNHEKDAARCYTSSYANCKQQKEYSERYLGKPPRIIEILLSPKEDPIEDRKRKNNLRT